MNYIIGISGKAGHGKDSLAKMIDKFFTQDTLYDVKVVYFADKLKQITADLLDVNWTTLYDELGKDCKISHMGMITGRRALQVIGTDISRKIYRDIWIYHYKKTIDSIIIHGNGDYKNTIILTPDMRFENEYNLIKNGDFHKDILGIKPKTFVIKVIRPEFFIREGSEHESEIALDHIQKWDFKAIAKDMINLKEEAKRICEKLRFIIGDSSLNLEF